MKNLLNNKWLSGALPGLCLHVSIGTVYCWSLFKTEIAEKIGYSIPTIEWAFSLAIFFLGMSAAFGGNIVEKNVKVSSLISTLCYTLGMIGTGASIICQSLIGLYLSYGVIMGIGLGIGYLTPVKTLMMWFKDNKGLATGIAITGFGLAKVIASPAIEYLLSMTTIENMFFILSSVYFLLMLIGTLLIKKPKTTLSHKGDKFNLKKSLEIIFNPTYITIWLFFFINITCGLALISNEKSIINWTNCGISIGLVAAITAFFNAFGRFGYSTFSDKLKRRSIVYEVIFITSAFSTLSVFLSGVFAQSFIPGLVLMSLMFVNLGYGGGFSTLPSLLADKFGMKNVSVIHGFCLSAWAWAGLAGNNMGYYIITKANHEKLFQFLGILYLIAFIFAMRIRNLK